MQLPGLGSKRLLVVGASARAAAASVKRAGHKPLAADMYCDSDLRALCQCERLSPYPHDAKRVFADVEADAWMYVGGLENYPHLVGTLASQLPLLGNSCDVLRQVRNPWRVAGILREHGITVPHLMPPGQRPKSGRWICKPVRSCGGKGAIAWDPHAAMTASKVTPTNKELSRRIFQERIYGRAVGAVFVADAAHSQLVGVTQQLVGTAWLGAQGYTYSGSIGPLTVNSAARQQLKEIGAALAAAFGLRGIFGVDAIWDGESIWLIEVNPRYTASVEVLERALDVSVVRAHLQACQSKLTPLNAPSKPPRVSGKAILYAGEDFVVAPRLLDFIAATNSDSGALSIADIPACDQRISKGHPVVSLLADAADDRQVVRQLQQLAHAIYSYSGTHFRPANSGS